MYYLTLFMSKAESSNEVQYSDEPVLNQAIGSLLLTPADCTLFVWISYQDTIPSSAIVMSHPSKTGEGIAPL